MENRGISYRLVEFKILGASVTRLNSRKVLWVKGRAVNNNTVHTNTCTHPPMMYRGNCGTRATGNPIPTVEGATG